VTDSEILLLEVFIAQVIAAVLGSVSIAAADWSYHTGHMRQALHSVWVSCSVTAICFPILAWTSSVFLGSGIFGQGLVGIFTGLIFLWVHRNFPKFSSLRRAVRGNFCCTRSNAFQSSTELYLPLAGLVPATHVFAVHSTDQQEGVDGRAKPGHGGSSIVQTTVRTTGFDSPDSPASTQKSPYASPSPTVSSEPFVEERRADAGS
jgi:hypothetical protein